MFFTTSASICETIFAFPYSVLYFLMIIYYCNLKAMRIQFATSGSCYVPSNNLNCFFVFYNTQCSFLMVFCCGFFQTVLFYNINFHFWFYESTVYHNCVVVYYNCAFSTQLCLVNSYFWNTCIIICISNFWHCIYSYDVYCTVI